MILLRRVTLLFFVSLLVAATVFSVYAENAKPLTQKEREKKFLAEQQKKWPNLKGRALKDHLSVILNTPIYDNEKLTAYVQEVGEKILAQTPHAGQDYRFIVLDDPNPNAFTMMQPYIYVNRGLIALYQSESHLAGVLGHEIAHNIDKAGTKKRRKAIGDSVFATTMSILAGNTAVGNAIATQQQIGQAKYSQERELEADRLGASYLYQAGYDTNGLMGGLGSMFDFIRAGLQKSTIEYRPWQSHPRNDKRLNAVLREIGELPPGEAFEGRAEYRDAIDGMVFGPNLRPNAPPGYVRYNNEKLGITFLHPEDWSRKIKGSRIIVMDPSETMQFKVQIEKTKNKAQPSEKTIKEKYPEGLTDLKKIDPKSPKDLGMVAVHSNQRVGLVKIVRNTFHFQGISRDNKLTKQKDQIFLGMIASFRRMHPKDKNLTEIKRLYFEQLKPGESFATIVADKNDDNVGTEAELRAINGYFPKGEPEPGTWIKKIRLVKIDQNDRKAAEAADKVIN